KEIETQRALDNRGLELAWLNDPVEVFFLQVQGSGRIKLTDGNTMRVGFGGKNNHKYRSIGRELVRRGVFNKHQVSAGRIKSWVRQNPRDGKRLLQHNPSFVFFREITEISPKDGPIGAMGASVTTQRTLAVDPKYTPLGAPVWIEKDGVDSMARLMVAQDTGSAIKGAQRSDVFCGSGTAAGKVAGRMKDHGRMVVLLPALKAYELVGTIK
ncbi:MAG: MltA domain-containing protein, partial [Halocynthiibacter sp.]